MARQMPVPRRPAEVSRRSLLGGAFALGAVALGGVTAACSSDSGGGNGGSPTAGAPDAQNGEPQRGGTLRVATSDGVGQDYFVGRSFGAHLATWMQFAWPLFLASPTEVDLINALAEEYEAAPDGLTHTITLRSGLTFHDGSPLDAEAVAENIRAAIFEDHPLRDEGPYEMATAGFGVPTVVDSVKTTDELTIQLMLNSPMIDVRDPLWQFPILNPAIMANPDYGTDPAALADAGSGPFRLVKFEPSGFVEFERFEGFFEEALLDRLRFDLVQESAQLGLGLRSGDYDVALQLAQTDHEQLGADPTYQPLIAPEPGKNVFIWFNTPTKPELEDKRVREAIWLALNRPAYRDAFFNEGTAFPSTQPGVIAGTDAYDPDLTERPYDPDQARELLAEAGVDGLTLEIATAKATGPISGLQNMLEAMTADLAEVGIELQVTITDPGTAESEWEANDFNVLYFDGLDQLFLTRLMLMGFEGGYKEPDPRAHPDVARLISAAADSVDLDERNQYLHEALQLNHDEIMMAIPIAMVASSGIARAEVRDFRMSPVANDPQHKSWLANA